VLAGNLDRHARVIFYELPVDKASDILNAPSDMATAIPLVITPRKGGRNYVKLSEDEIWDRRVIQFFSNVQFSDDCWLWTGPLQTAGYGSFSIAGARIGAHRFSYRYFYGAIPVGLCVLHRCDVPKCVRPNHLWVGTKRDNLVDCYAKGRANPPSGQRHPFAKLTPEKVRQIRELWSSKTISMRGIGRLYDVTLAAVQDVLKQETWKSVV
jgi:HNH endonuclease